jgi:hypothetical protein
MAHGEKHCAARPDAWSSAAHRRAPGVALRAGAMCEHSGCWIALPFQPGSPADFVIERAGKFFHPGTPEIAGQTEMVARLDQTGMAVSCVQIGMAGSCARTGKAAYCRIAGRSLNHMNFCSGSGCCDSRSPNWLIQNDWHWSLLWSHHRANRHRHRPAFARRRDSRIQSHRGRATG